MRLTIVIPTFNESENLARLVSTIFSLPLEFSSVLVVDDNSPDGTGQVAERLTAEYPGRLSLIRRTGKLGLGSAYVAGFRQALEIGSEAIGQMDADFSHSPEKIPQLVEAVKSSDIAIGSRYVQGGGVDRDWPLWRKGLSAFGNFYARKILDLPIRDVTGGFRIWRREVLQEMPLEGIRSNGYVFMIECAHVAHRLGYIFQEVPIYFADRRWGQSKMSLRIQLEAAFRVWQIRVLYRDLKRVG